MSEHLPVWARVVGTTLTEQYFTSLLETPVFKEQFGIFTTDESGYSSWQLKSSDKSLWVSIIQVGEVVGSLLAGPIGYVPNAACQNRD